MILKEFNLSFLNFLKIVTAVLGVSYGSLNRYAAELKYERIVGAPFVAGYCLCITASVRRR